MNLLRQLMIFSSMSMVTLLSFAASDAGDGATVQSFALAQRGYVELEVPSGWRAEVSPTTKPEPPIITFAPREGEPFIVTVTPVWRTAANKLTLSKNGVRKRVEYALRGIRLFAVERNIGLSEIKGASGPGYYFSATDKAPLAGGYKLMTKGEILVNDITVVFTILTNEGQEAIVRQALAMVQSARRVPGARPKVTARENGGSAQKR